MQNGGLKSKQESEVWTILIITDYVAFTESNPVDEYGDKSGTFNSKSILQAIFASAGILPSNPAFNRLLKEWRGCD